MAVGLFVAVVIWAAVAILTCVLDAACLDRLQQQGTTVTQYGSAAAAGAWSLGGAATRTAWHNFPQLPKAAMCALGAAESMASASTFNAATGSRTTGSDLSFAAFMGCATGGSGGGGGGGSASLSKLRSVLKSLSDRQFDRFLESLETQAAVRGSSPRSIDETRVILDEALNRGWTIEPHGVADDWVGGRHIDLLNPLQLKRIHFPIPEGMVPRAQIAHNLHAKRLPLEWNSRS